MHMRAYAAPGVPVESMGQLGHFYLPIPFPPPHAISLLIVSLSLFLLYFLFLLFLFHLPPFPLLFSLRLTLNMFPTMALNQYSRGVL